MKMTEELKQAAFDNWGTLPIFHEAGNIEGKLEALDALAQIFKHEAEEQDRELQKAEAWMADTRTPSVVLRDGMDAAKVLRKAVDYMTYGNTIWQKCYDIVADWLYDNCHKGIVISGRTGAGKTMMGDAISLVLQHATKYPIFTTKTHARDLADVIRDGLPGKAKRYNGSKFAKEALFIDDLGTEGEATIGGTKMYAFRHLIEEYNGGGMLLIITSNLTMDKIEKMYKARTYDRLRELIDYVVFDNESMRDTWQCGELGERKGLPVREGQGKENYQYKKLLYSDYAGQAVRFAELLRRAADLTPAVAKRIRPDMFPYLSENRTERVMAALQILEALKYDGDRHDAEMARIAQVMNDARKM